MRITLSQTDSMRWASGPDAAWQVEESVLAWATTHQVAEPVVVVLDTGQVAFAFTVTPEQKATP